MRWFVKRLFTLPCKLIEKEGGSAIAGPPFFFLWAVFYLVVD
jgi:hypothetical protein